MQYRKIICGETVIEFHNNWLGEETVIANGQLVSKKSSVYGTNHPFNVLEQGNQVRYVLRTRVNDNLAVVLDIKRNGTYIHEDLPVKFAFGTGIPQNKAKKNGLRKLNEYDLDEALDEFVVALETDPQDPEIYFHMACAYSIQEKTEEGFESLRKAVKNKLADTEMILNHDMLAFLRMHPAFEDFLHSGFSIYNKRLVAKKPE
jgi:tetratricopeptide (TPR) repeat protein